MPLFVLKEKKKDATVRAMLKEKNLKISGRSSCGGRGPPIWLPEGK